MLPVVDRSALLRWASTKRHNLEHDPVGCLIASAFFPTSYLWAWPVLIAFAMFGANRALGNWRTAMICAAGTVIGTLISEGIIGYRVLHGSLPSADRFLIDVGPSYVVVSAIAVAVYGGWLARARSPSRPRRACLIGRTFDGLTSLEVSAVGHVTALAVGVLAGSLLAWQRRRITTSAVAPALGGAVSPRRTPSFPVRSSGPPGRMT